MKGFNRVFKKFSGGDLMKKRFILYYVISLMCIFLLSCGGGSGSPGSQGTEDTGVIVDAEIKPRYLNEETYSVDAFQDNDCDDNPDTNDPEDFETHVADVTFTARLMNPNTTVKPGTLYIEYYTIEYRRSNDSIGAPPIEMFTGYQTIVITPPEGKDVTSVTATVVFFDLKRKFQYWEDILSGQYSYHPAYLNDYTAIYTFYGKNEHGTRFKIKATMSFEIGNFDNC